MSFITNLRNTPGGTIHFSGEDKQLAVKTEGFSVIRLIKSVLYRPSGNKYNEVRKEFARQFEQNYKGILKEQDFNSLSKNINTHSRAPLKYEEVHTKLQSAQSLARERIKFLTGIPTWSEKMTPPQCETIAKYVDRFQPTKEKFSQLINPVQAQELYGHVRETYKNQERPPVIDKLLTFLKS